MNCLFQKHGDNLVCINCGYFVPYKEYENGIKRACKKPKSTVANIIKNGAIEIKKQAGAIVQQKTIISEPEKVKERMEICSNCEHFQYDRCKLCGCFANLKARLENSNCPIGKW